MERAHRAAAKAAAGDQGTSWTTGMDSAVLSPAVSEPHDHLGGIRVLSLDGGAMRELFTIDMLRAIEAELGGRRVADCFDLIVGTSAGACLAASLVLGKSVDEIEEEYWMMALSCKTQQPSSVAGALRLLWRGHTTDSVNLEDQLVKIFGTAKLCDLRTSPRLLFVATETTQPVPRPFLFRNTPSTEGPFACESGCSIADALRASTAAPTIYASHKVNGRSIVDGAIHSNNPVLFAIAEAKLMFPGQHIDVLVSIGTATHGQEEPAPLVEPESSRSWTSTILDTISIRAATTGDKKASPVVEPEAGFRSWTSTILDTISMRAATTGHKEAQPAVGPQSLLSWTSTILGMATESEAAGNLAASIIGPNKYVRLSPPGLINCNLWETDATVLARWRAHVHKYCAEKKLDLQHLGQRLSAKSRR